jgi:hypothetical protein
MFASCVVFCRNRCDVPLNDNFVSQLSYTTARTVRMALVKTPNCAIGFVTCQFLIPDMTLAAVATDLIQPPKEESNRRPVDIV